MKIHNIKRRKTNFSKFWLFLIIASAFSMPAMADCTSMNFIGTSKVDALNKSVANYDQLALEYNQRIKISDTAFTNKTDLDKPWSDVLTSRNKLIKSGNETKIALGDLFEFNKNFISMGCMQSDITAIETEYKQSIARLDNSQQTLSQVPVDWRIRYQKAISCEKLNALAKAADTRGRNWSEKYDQLITEFETAMRQLSATPVSDPAYTKLRQKLIQQKKRAIPGVNGYPPRLSAIYDTTIKLQQAGCIALTPAELTSYQSRHQAIMTEIRAKQAQMQNVEQIFPASRATLPTQPKTSTTPPLRTSPEPAVTTPPTPMANIHLRNRSGDILCLYIADTKQTLCNFMPNTLRTIKASSVTAFGGGYWAEEGKYMEMKVCRNILPGNTVVQVTRGLDANCQAAR
jgi:hypothetical protein